MRLLFREKMSIFQKELRLLFGERDQFMFSKSILGFLFERSVGVLKEHFGATVWEISRCFERAFLGCCLRYRSMF